MWPAGPITAPTPEELGNLDVAVVIVPGAFHVEYPHTGADGKLYMMNENGDVFVCSADEFKVLSKVSLGGEPQSSRGSIAAVDGMIVIRTGDRMWAFGKKQ